MIKSKKIGFNSIVIGNNQRTLDLVKELKSDKTAQGFLLQGYVNGNDEQHILRPELPMIGTYQLSELIKQYDIEEVIIGIESSRHQEINTCNKLKT
jgi:FlaA1/EpsC-like NDP-sugar epimerase